jgi:hypothetical protein
MNARRDLANSNPEAVSGSWAAGGAARKRSAQDENAAVAGGEFVSRVWGGTVAAAVVGNGLDCVACVVAAAGPDGERDWRFQCSTRPATTINNRADGQR